MTNWPQSPALPAAVAAEHTFLQIPSQPEWIAPTVEYLKDKAIQCGACPEVRATKLMLALHEALTNSVIHGNLELSSDLKERSDNSFAEALAVRAADPHYGQRAVEMCIDYDGERCRWTFTDQGRGFDVERVLARAAQPEPENVLCSGRGILLMRAFLDDVQYELGGRRTVLTLARPEGEEKRRAVRLPVERPVRVAPLGSDGIVDWEAAYEAMSRNLSADGIAILQAKLAASERVLLGIDWQGQLLYVPAEVRHCQTRGGNLVELGCRFQIEHSSADMESPASAAVEDAIDKLLAEASAASVRPDERRSHPRAAYTGRILIESEPGREPVAGFGRDLSRGGISFLTSVDLSPGRVNLVLSQPNRKPLRVVARIIRCNPLVAGVFDVGACFLDVAGSHAER